MILGVQLIWSISSAENTNFLTVELLAENGRAKYEGI